MEHIFGKTISPQAKQRFKLIDQARSLENKNKQKILSEWKAALERDFRLVHSISGQGGLSNKGETCWKNHPLFSQKTEDVLSGWDIVSTSCVNFNRGNISGGVALEVALILDVPYQNILGTHLRDVWFDNFAGLEGGKPGGKVIDKSALSRNIFLGIEKKNPRFKMDKPYNTLLHPDVFRRSESLTRNDRYNEVLIIGRPGVQLYTGIPPTQKIRINSIYFKPNYLHKMKTNKTQQTFLNDIAAIHTMMSINDIDTLYYDYAYTLLDNPFFAIAPGTKNKLKLKNKCLMKHPAWKDEFDRHFS